MTTSRIIAPPGGLCVTESCSNELKSPVVSSSSVAFFPAPPPTAGQSKIIHTAAPSAGRAGRITAPSISSIG